MLFVCFAVKQFYSRKFIFAACWSWEGAINWLYLFPLESLKVMLSMVSQADWQRSVKAFQLKTEIDRECVWEREWERARENWKLFGEYDRSCELPTNRCISKAPITWYPSKPQCTAKWWTFTRAKYSELAYLYWFRDVAQTAQHTHFAFFLQFNWMILCMFCILFGYYIKRFYAFRFYLSLSRCTNLHPN